MPHVLLNSQARRFQSSRGLLDVVRRLVGQRGTVWVTSTLDELAEAAARIAREPDRVALCGGDGTFMAGLTALTQACGGSPPPLAFIPAGTVGTVAAQWGATGEVGAAVDAFLRLEAGFETVPRATLRVIADGHERCGFTFGTGLVARFFTRYYAAGGGLPVAAAIFARVFAGSLIDDVHARAVLEPMRCALTVDGIRLSPPAFSLIVSSVLPSVGLGLRVTYRGGEDPARPHLVASSLAPAALGPQALRVLAGRGLRPGDGFDGLVDGFTVTFPPGEEGPFVLDGDLFQAHEIGVAAGPRIAVVASSRS